MSPGLYAIKWTFQYLTKRYPRYERVFFFISVLRNAFVIIVLTIAAWLYCRHRKNSKGAYPISLLLTVPRGFQVRSSLQLSYLFINIFPIECRIIPCRSQTRKSFRPRYICGNYYSLVGAHLHCQVCVCIHSIEPKL